MTITRRHFLGSTLAAAGALVLWPRLTVAATGADARFVFVLLRGGLDGLEAVPPWGDPGYAAIRGALALSPAGAAAGAKAAHKLDATFALHPALAYAAELYAAGEFMPLVAAAPPYWGRSHFDAQDCVENGTGAPHGAQTGWLNRCVAALPGARGLAVASVMPLCMRGPARVDAWSPPLPTAVSPVWLQRLQPLYAADPALRGAFEQALAAQSADTTMALRHGMASARGTRGQLPMLLAAAGGFMGKPDGSRIAFVEDSGWDTHANEAAILRRKLAELDAGLKACRDAIGDAWHRTVMVIATEFGRTAAINGTGGTDHGTGGMLFLAGGAIAGGRVAGNWPGIGRRALYQGRDLHATTDLRAVFKGVLSAHLGVAEAALETAVFPGSKQVRMLEGLVATRSKSARMTAVT
ncbi:MAG TPA: DUF1501 domain-containing protein [Rhodanobacteraceae bacterium]|nr:DUF1501 domain-containing protein [Rhodanobacteraceae bacterium]